MSSSQFDEVFIICRYANIFRSWLFHCHIAWHASQGLALQLVESASDIPAIMVNDVDDMIDTCSAWIPFYDSAAQADSKQDDSGI
jgi:hypothetical protein